MAGEIKPGVRKRVDQGSLMYTRTVPGYQMPLNEPDKRRVFELLKQDNEKRLRAAIVPDCNGCQHLKVQHQVQKMHFDDSEGVASRASCGTGRCVMRKIKSPAWAVASLEPQTPEAMMAPVEYTEPPLEMVEDSTLPFKTAHEEMEEERRRESLREAMRSNATIFNPEKRNTLVQFEGEVLSAEEVRAILEPPKPKKPSHYGEW